MEGAVLVVEREKLEEAGLEGIISRRILGRMLASARTAKGMTQEDVAALVRQRWGYDLSAESLSYYETGRRRIYLDIFYAVIDVTETRGGERHFDPMLDNSALRKLRSLRAE